MAEKVTRDHTLPASWWVSEKIYELEKRAIFSKVDEYPVDFLSVNSLGNWY